MRLPNGYGSIYKMSDKRRNKWRVYAPTIVDENEKKVRKTLGCFATRDEAMTCLVEYHKNPTLFKAKYISLKDLYNKWLNVHKQSISPNTIKLYETSFKHFKSIENVSINDLNLDILQSVVSNLSNGVKKIARTLLIMIFDYGVKLDLLQKNYAKYIEIGVVKKSVIRNIYTQPQIAVLWQNSNEFEAKCLLILIYSGMRVNELINIKRENVFIDEEYIIGGSKTKAGINRTIPIHRFIKPIIEDFYKENNNTLLGYKYSPNTLICAIRKYTKRIGMEHTTHDTRYTFASLMELSGVPLLITQKIMGHSAGNLTQDLYTKIDYKELVNAVNKIVIC